MPRFRFSQYLSILFLCATFLVIPAPNSVTAQMTTKVAEQELPSLLHSLQIPVYAGEKPMGSQFASLSASSIYIMDRGSGAILYQKNANAPRYPASTAKMMTALVARRNYKLDDVLTVKEEAFSTGSTVGLKVGEQLTVAELLKALLIPSGNDAAFVLANHHTDGYTGFVKNMNDLAQQLHLSHSEFRNPSGLDNDQQSATARDLAILANEVMKDPVLRAIVDQKFAVAHDVSGLTQHPLNNTNELLAAVDGVVGIKTGTTTFAGENLITEVDRNGHKVIIVMLGSKDRFAEMKQVIDWVYSNYRWQQIEH